MDLKAFEKRRVRGLHRRIIRNLNSRRRYAERKGRASLPTQSLFGSSSTATTYWTPWTASVFGIKLFSGTQIAGTRKKDSLTSVSLNLQNLESCSAVPSQRNYCQSHYQRMSLMKRVRIGGSFFGRTPTI